MGPVSPFVSSDGNTIASGSHWTVLVQSSFVDQAFEAAHLVSRPALGPSSKQAATSGPSEFSQAIKTRASTLVEQQQATAAEEDDETEPVVEVKPDTEEFKEAKRKIVADIWTKIVPGCFVRADDRELEAALDLLLILWIPLFQDQREFESMLNALVEAVSKADGRVTYYGRCTAITSIFNSIPSTVKDSPLLQLSVLLRLATLASSESSDLALVVPAVLRLPSYLSTWGLTGSSVARDAIIQVASVLERDGQGEHAYSLCTSYLRQPGAMEQSIAAQAVRLALSLPDCYDWDTLLPIPSVQEYVRSPAGSRSLAIFNALKSGHLAETQNAIRHAGDQLSPVAKENVECKAKLLALADLCGTRVGGEVQYQEVKDCLGLSGNIEDDDGMEVEEWIINAIKAKLLSARLHQPSHVIHVMSATPRTFGKAEWQTLLDRLKSWTSSVESIVSVVAQSLPAGSRGAASEGLAGGDTEGEQRTRKAGVLRQIEDEVPMATVAA